MPVFPKALGKSIGSHGGSIRQVIENVDDQYNGHNVPFLSSLRPIAAVYDSIVSLRLMSRFQRREIFLV